MKGKKWASSESSGFTQLSRYGPTGYGLSLLFSFLQCFLSSSKYVGAHLSKKSMSTALFLATAEREFLMGTSYIEIFGITNHQASFT
jgi:hypothetical protein